MRGLQLMPHTSRLLWRKPQVILNSSLTPTPPSNNQQLTIKLEKSMSDNRLDGGGQLPELKLKVGQTDVISLPNDIETDYAIILFYRGYW